MSIQITVSLYEKKFLVGKLVFLDVYAGGGGGVLICLISKNAKFILNKKWITLRLIFFKYMYTFTSPFYSAVYIYILNSLLDSRLTVLHIGNLCFSRNSDTFFKQLTLMKKY